MFLLPTKKKLLSRVLIRCLFVRFKLGNNTTPLLSWARIRGSCKTDFLLENDVVTPVNYVILVNTKVRGQAKLQLCSNLSHFRPCAILTALSFIDF